MLMSPKAKESILTFCSELCLTVFVLDDGEKEKVSKRIFELHVKKESVIYNVHVFAVPANKKGILMIYALISGHPAGVDPGECAGICAMMVTNLPHPRIVFLYQRAATSPLTLHISWFK